jgi:opacity protein-like surface antigen
MKASTVARIVGACLALGAIPAAGQGAKAGPEVSNSQDTDFGVGLRAVLDLGPLDFGFRVMGSFDLFFPSDYEFDQGGVTIMGDADYWEANLDLAYELGLPLIPIKPYVGGGLNIAHIEVKNTPDDQTFGRDQTDKGVNVLGGVEFDFGGFAPFLELRYEILGGEQWVVTGGILFG